MRIACVLVEHFAAAVSEKRQPDLDGVPLVIGGLPHERKHVYDASPAAAVYGVGPGMTLREAHQRCPRAVFLPLEAAVYENAFARLLTALEVFTPAVEVAALGCAYLDLRHLALPPGGEPQLAAELAEAVATTTGLAAQVGLARNIFVARVAAERAGPERLRVIPPGAERDLLYPLPVSALPLSAEALRRLRLLGIDTVGALAALSAEAVTVQLGAEGAAAHRLAGGIDERRVRPREQEREVAEEREFDDPIADEARLSLVVDHLADQLMPRLQREYLFCGQVALTLRLADGETQSLVAHLREPSQDGETVARAVKRTLGENARGSGVVAFRMTLSALGGQTSRQLSLFAPRQGRLEQLAAAASRLRTRLGAERLYKAVITDARATLPERRFTLVEYR